MAGRKLIGIIIENPEAIYQQRVLDGIFSQCAEYGFDTAVFSPLVQSCHFDKDYLNAELNIFNLINFERLDAVIAVPISFSDNQLSWLREQVLAKLERECHKPVAALDLPFGDYPVFYTDDRSAFSSITSHVLDVHGCDKIYFLTGAKGYNVAEERLAGFTDELKRRGLHTGGEDKSIFYGDFWYTSGEQLADRIAGGEIEMPQAVICASDHMAIGLANKLIEHGISVPGQVIVTGYDATAEAAINTPAITSYIPDIGKAAAEAVNYLHGIIEPDTETVPVHASCENGIRLCASCGCHEDYGYVKERLRDSVFNINHNFGEKDSDDNVDISRLLSSYMFEEFTNAASVRDCFWKILGKVYLLRPYSDFYLCLKENWLDTDDCTVVGYPEKMNNVIHNTPDAQYTGNCESYHISTGSEYLFDTKLMIPQLDEERSKPYAFYFVPVHFNDETLGYAVLQCSLTQKKKINNVFHNWIRNVNNALEMVRIQNKLTNFSERDAMTGLYNRRGMKSRLFALMENVKENDSCIAFVIDVDGLKFINDNYGHEAGDFAIKEIADAAWKICRLSEICVRAGGDEFYIIGIGKYSPEEAEKRQKEFALAIEEKNRDSHKPFEISASIGGCCGELSEAFTIDNALRSADSEMYKNKFERKKSRGE